MQVVGFTLACPKRLLWNVIDFWFCYRYAAAVSSVYLLLINLHRYASIRVCLLSFTPSRPIDTSFPLFDYKLMRQRQRFEHLDANERASEWVSEWVCFDTINTMQTSLFCFVFFSSFLQYRLLVFFHLDTYHWHWIHTHQSPCST